MAKSNQDAKIPYRHLLDLEISSQAVRTALEDKGLSKREIEVLTWVARGKTNSEIGMILHISPRTVSKHLERVYSNLGVECRAAAVYQVLEIIQDGRQNQISTKFDKEKETDKKLVLLVDDDSILRKAIHSLIESEKFLSQDEKHETAVLAKLKADQADSTLTVDPMPILGGTPPPVDVPTGTMNEKVKDRAFKAGAFTALKKHAKFSELLLVVAQAIEFSINTQLFQKEDNFLGP